MIPPPGDTRHCRPPPWRLIALYEQLSPEHLAALDAYYAPDAHFKDPFNDVRGVPAIRKSFAHMFAAGSARFAVTQHIAGGDQAFLGWEFLSYAPLAPAGEQCIHGATLVRFDAQAAWRCTATTGMPPVRETARAGRPDALAAPIRLGYFNHQGAPCSPSITLKRRARSASSGCSKSWPFLRDIRLYRRDPVSRLAPAALKQIHQLGKSPVVTDGDTVVAESGAIIEYLVERFGAQARNELAQLEPARGHPNIASAASGCTTPEGSLMNWLVMKLVFDTIPRQPMPFCAPDRTRPMQQSAAKLIHPNVQTALAFIDGHLARTAGLPAST